jgi:plasmid stabilization system protein ParE
MEKAARKVVFLPKAEFSIFQFYAYIVEEGFPKRAEHFKNQLYDFGKSLAKAPSGHAICSQPQLAKRNLRCAVFKKNYIFVYKVIDDEVVIFNVIHSRTNPEHFST